MGSNPQKGNKEGGWTLTINKMVTNNTRRGTHWIGSYTTTTLYISQSFYMKIEDESPPPTLSHGNTYSHSLSPHHRAISNKKKKWVQSQSASFWNPDRFDFAFILPHCFYLHLHFKRNLVFKVPSLTINHMDCALCILVIIWIFISFNVM